MPLWSWRTGDAELRGGEKSFEITRGEDDANVRGGTTTVRGEFARGEPAAVAFSARPVRGDQTAGAAGVSTFVGEPTVIARPRAPERRCPLDVPEMYA